MNFSLPDQLMSGFVSVYEFNPVTPMLLAWNFILRGQGHFHGELLKGHQGQDSKGYGLQALSAHVIPCLVNCSNFVEAAGHVSCTCCILSFPTTGTDIDCPPSNSVIFV